MGIFVDEFDRDGMSVERMVAGIVGRNKNEFDARTCDPVEVGNGLLGALPVAGLANLRVDAFDASGFAIDTAMRMTKNPEAIALVTRELTLSPMYWGSLATMSTGR